MECRFCKGTMTGETLATGDHRACRDAKAAKYEAAYWAKRAREEEARKAIAA